MANLPLQPMQGATLQGLTRLRTFREYYSDETRDPCKGSYSRIMDRFDPEVNNAVSHVMLLEQAIGSGVVPQAYLCCAHVQQQMRIYCLHLPSKFTSLLDGRVTPWDGKCFAFLGEVSHGVVTTVTLPDNAFRTVQARVRPVDYFVTHLEDLTAMGFQPVDQAEPDSTITYTRRLMYLPARYVPLLLDSAGYNLKQVWEILYPAIVQHNDLQHCETLLKWLSVASVGTPLNNGALALSATVIDLSSPVADHDLITH
jgi:hypothetical protein